MPIAISFLYFDWTRVVREKERKKAKVFSKLLKVNKIIFLHLYLFSSFLSSTLLLFTHSHLSSCCYLVGFLLFFPNEGRHITSTDDAASDEFDTQFPPHFKDELTSVQEGRTRIRRKKTKKNKNKKVKNIYIYIYICRSLIRETSKQAEICVG